MRLLPFCLFLSAVAIAANTTHEEELGIGGLLLALWDIVKGFFGFSPKSDSKSSHDSFETARMQEQEDYRQRYEQDIKELDALIDELKEDHLKADESMSQLSNAVLLDSKEAKEFVEYLDRIRSSIAVDKPPPMLRHAAN